MTRHLRSLSVAATLMVALAAPTASANLPPNDEEKEDSDKKGGNGADKATLPSATAKPAATNPASRPPINYTEEAIDFWGLFLSSGSPFAGALEAADVGRGTLAPPDLELITSPPDAPAESVLDQIDERLAPPVLVGQPGSEASSATGSGNNAGAGTASVPAPSAGETPPPESILDFIDTAPAPKPVVSTTQEAAKPAVNQAPKPAVVKTPPP